ncbi:galactose-specific lectin nattectin-like [Xiphophorus hellerii]|uniref:galactose-specific lectin nattectin-like n=1 Tax=Xiphophorus hellerii TaxID=8084 RepID=UPI0013B45F46|nr:galactose-specific lectin nattectin-like [Xiphophorus hellerii]
MKALSLLLLLCALLALSQPAALPDAMDGAESDEALPEGTREDPDTEDVFPEDHLALHEEEPGNWTGAEEPTFEPVDEEAYLKALNATVRRSGSCSPGWTRVKGRCYHVFPFGATWHRAQENCRSIQAHLASIHDYEVNNQLVRMIMSAGRGHTAVWIGGNDIIWERHWRWVDGSPFNYSNWCRYEPNNLANQDCLQINYSRHRCWDDAQCNFRRPFICVKNI